MAFESFSVLGTVNVLRLASSKTRGGVLTLAFFGFLASLPWGFFIVESYAARAKNCCGRTSPDATSQVSSVDLTLQTLVIHVLQSRAQLFTLGAEGGTGDPAL